MWRLKKVRYPVYLDHPVSHGIQQEWVKVWLCQESSTPLSLTFRNIFHRKSSISLIRFYGGSTRFNSSPEAEFVGLPDKYSKDFRQTLEAICVSICLYFHSTS